MAKKSYRLVSTDEHYSLGQGPIMKAFATHFSLIERIDLCPTLGKFVAGREYLFKIILSTQTPPGDVQHVCGKFDDKKIYNEFVCEEGKPQLYVSTKNEKLDSLIEDLEREAKNQGHRFIIKNYYIGGDKIEEMATVTSFAKRLSK